MQVTKHRKNVEKHVLVALLCIAVLVYLIKYGLFSSIQVPIFPDLRSYEIEVTFNQNTYLLHKPFYDNICKSDKPKTDLILNTDLKLQESENLRQLFNRFVMNPHSGRCSKIQRFGGEFKTSCKYWDGHKFVCVDELYKDLQIGECLIYSFGIDSDYSFEEAMDQFGCKVYAFDHTRNYGRRLGNSNILFEKLGVSAKSDPEKELQTLSHILHSHGHTNTKITYLKMDIEGHEIDGLGQWLESGALRNVQQIGFEYHLDDTESTLKLFNTLIKLYFEDDFRLISFDLNGCARAEYREYHKFAEIVLMRPSKRSICHETIKLKNELI